MPHSTAARFRQSGSDQRRHHPHPRAPVAAATTINRLQQAQTYGAAKGQLDTQDKSTQDATIEQARVALGANEPGSFGYSTAILRYNSLRGAQQEILNHRAANPVGADRGSLRLTQPLDMSNPAFLQGPLNARYEQAATLSQKWNTPYKPLDDGQGGGIDEVGPLATFLQQGEANGCCQLPCGRKSRRGFAPGTLQRADGTGRGEEPDAGNRRRHGALRQRNGGQDHRRQL